MSQLHLEHAREHLERVRAGYIVADDPGRVFLGADDGEVFQELVGLRLAGLRTPVLVVFRFQGHGLPGIPHARESLASYLESPPRAPQSGPFAAPAGRVAALLPRADEAIPAFLRGLRAGRDVPSIVLDPRRVRLAFDFRAHNPSALEAVKQRAGPLRTYALRTVDGHVLTGRSSDMGGSEDHRFVALSDAVQFTPRGPVRIPSVMLNTSWVALWMDVSEEATRLAAAHWVPFLAADANPDIVLGLTSRPAPASAPLLKPAGPGAPRITGRAGPV